MPFILETGNKHKANIFKEYKSQKWPEDPSSGYFYVYSLRDNFYNEAVIGLDLELLAFRQVAQESILPNDFTSLEHTCSSSLFLYTPKYIEVIPEVFAGSGIIEPDKFTIENTIEIGGNKCLVRNIVDKHDLPQNAHIVNVSSVELLLKLIAKSEFTFPSKNVLCVLRKEEGFHLLLLQNNKLLFANTFDFTSYEEVLYFCLNTLKDSELTQEDTTLLFSQTQYSEHASKLWTPYFSKVTSIEECLSLPSYQGEVSFDLQEFKILFQLPKCV